jgi:proteasome accessory factor C
MSRLTAADRMARLLAVIPWVAERDGATLDEISERFSYPVDALLSDLEHVVLFVGVYPFTPDTLIDVTVDDGRVWIHYADYFTEPMRLEPEQGLALISAGRSVLEFMPDEDGPLLRALAKLGSGFGADAVDVRLSDAAAPTLAVIRDALRTGVSIEIDYYSSGRDELTHRRVDPQRLFARDGYWYLSGYCYRADGDRVFRVDRIDEIVALDEPSAHDAITAGGTELPIEATALPIVTLRLAPEDQWVATSHPHHTLEDPSMVELPVSADAWLARLLLRLGANTEVVAIDDPYSIASATDTAHRIRKRYNQHRGA